MTFIRLLILGSLSVLALPLPSPAQVIHHVRERDRIQIYETQPTRKHVRLGPVWATDTTMEGALKKLRRQAVKLKADAIAGVKVTTHSTEVEGLQINGLDQLNAGDRQRHDPDRRRRDNPNDDEGLNIEWGGVNQPQPVIEGWAIRWVD